MTYGEKAEQLFLEGYNCAQAVFLAFSDLTKLPETTAVKLASSFGGGMGRMREVCGALSGAFMVLGILYGYDSPLAKAEKADHYARIQQVAGWFREKYGTIVCRELLKDPTTLPAPEDRTPEYYRGRPCLRVVREAADLTARYITEHPIPE